jgi:hypothetical protein
MTAGDMEAGFSTISLAEEAARRIAAKALLARQKRFCSKLRQFAMHLSQERLQIRRSGGSMNVGRGFSRPSCHKTKTQNFQVETQP